MLSPSAEGGLAPVLRVESEQPARALVLAVLEILLASVVANHGKGLLRGCLVESLREDPAALPPSVCVGFPAEEDMVQLSSVELSLVRMYESRHDVLCFGTHFLCFALLAGQ